MKKKILLALTSILLVVTLCACSDAGDVFESKSYTADGAKINGIDIQVIDREIVALPSDDGQLHIDYAESAKEFYDISVSDNGILSMVSKCDKEWTDYIGLSKSAGADRITIRVPDAPLATLAVSTTREDISLSGTIVTEELTLSTDEGNVHFEEISDANSITVENKNGNIDGTIIGSYDDYAIACTIKKGTSNLPNNKSNGTKALTAINNNGDIDIEFIRE